LWIRLGSFAGDGRSFGELLEDQDEGFKRARYKRAKKKGYARETELSSWGRCGVGVSRENVLGSVISRSKSESSRASKDAEHGKNKACGSSLRGLEMVSGKPLEVLN
jgi:hypothetical protein